MDMSQILRADSKKSQTHKLTLDERIHFHEPHLQRVSRSFAYGISRLASELRASVGLAYLLCRVLDTIEDSRWNSLADQVEAFAGFENALRENIATDVIASWAKKFPGGVNEGERELLAQAPKLFAEFHSLAASEREALISPIQSMLCGMREYATRSGGHSELRLRDLTDVNTYCFFVAGVVGELLTRLFLSQTESLRPLGLKMLETGLDFGLFLQKINVLKDQWGDEKENRFLVPDRAELIESLHANARGAFDYFISIPVSRSDYRLFCAWALYLGLATVPLIRDSKIGDEAPKLSRLKATALGARIELSIQNDERLRALFSELESDAWGPTAPPEAQASVRTSRPKTESSFDNTSSSREILERCYSGLIDLDKVSSKLESRS